MANRNRQSKRENKDDDNRANKKIKTTQDVLHFLEGPDNEKITITKKLIEEVVMIKVAEILTESGDFGFARSKAYTTEIELENLKKQKCALMKTLDDQRKVIRKFIDDKKSMKNYSNKVIPAKVTRSVGVQVRMISDRLVHPQKPIQPPPAPLPKTFSPTIAEDLQTEPVLALPPNKGKRLKVAEILTESGDFGFARSKADTAENELENLKKQKCTELKPPFPPAPPKLGEYLPNVILPPKPTLRILRTTTDQMPGIMLSWFFTVKETTPISKFQVYFYKEGSDSGKDVWNKVGDVDAIALPMACILTQFKGGGGYKYYFSVRAIDKNSIEGPFSELNSESCVLL